MTHNEQPRDQYERFAEKPHSAPEAELREHLVTDEYAIDSVLFAQALRTQKQMRLKGGLYHLNQIQMAFNTNRIEGSQLTEEQTRSIFETRTVSGDAPIDDVVETDNSFRAFDEMLDHVGQPISADTLKDYHRTLKAGTADSRQPWFVVGGWKSLQNAVGGIETSPPSRVERDVTDLLAATPGRMTFEDIVDFHVRFERIHPFQDGNGRVGRLVMFEQCLANDIMPFIVLDAKKAFYYRGLSEYDDEPGFLRDTFREAQDTYYAQFSEFVPPAQ